MSGLIVVEGRAIVRLEDLFGNSDEKFDLVIANQPITDEAWPQIKAETKNIYARFFSVLPQPLNSGGECILPFASFGDIAGFEEILATVPLRKEIVVENRLDVNWFLIRLFAEHG